MKRSCVGRERLRIFRLIVVIFLSVRILEGFWIMENRNTALGDEC